MTASFPTTPTVVVTGAASPRGIGRATATRLAGHGWNVGLLDLDGGACSALAADLHERFGIAAYGVGADVVDRDAVRSAVDELEAALPPLVALANIAGVSSPVPYLDLDAAEWHRVLSINLDGVHNVSQRVAESLVRNGVGRIVSLSSVSAQRGGGTFSKAPYSVAKAGVIGLMRSLARELGSSASRPTRSRPVRSTPTSWAAP
ncbi:hypothetical protein GCM10025867_24870 [Frondihabitans sucicola]|uniref:SDR family NAD(P)-dependent oxidoreductase n=1 Tax=Frondihabitans sucicola TaxID=1268041 RepID=A0ABN6XZ84_9MICO|nr:hypothetical protein GCM10025867_24870 [Frondihabitans sucicola]